MIQSYPDQLLIGELVPWYDQCLSKSIPEEFKHQTGFQSCINNKSSDVRTRAHELYQLRLLKGPLIQPKGAGKGIPDGWKLVIKNEDVLTPLGHISYNVGCVFNDNSEIFNDIINLLCVVFVTSFVEQYDEEYFFLFELQKYIENNLKNFIVKDTDLSRYAAICLVSCIHSEKLDWITKNYKEQAELKSFLLKKEGADPDLSPRI